VHALCDDVVTGNHADRRRGLCGTPGRPWRAPDPRAGLRIGCNRRLAVLVMVVRPA